MKRELINKIAALFRRAKTEAARGASGMPDHPVLCSPVRLWPSRVSFLVYYYRLECSSKKRLRYKNGGTRKISAELEFVLQIQ